LASILDAEAQSELSAITTPGAISVSGTCRGRDDNPIPGISSRPWDFGYGFGMPSDYPWEY